MGKRDAHHGKYKFSIDRGIEKVNVAQSKNECQQKESTMA
jgi:hypothetical protein